jgi:hypothetical protein
MIDIHDPNISLSALNATDVVAMKVRSFGKLLLG